MPKQILGFAVAATFVAGCGTTPPAETPPRAEAAAVESAPPAAVAAEPAPPPSSKVEFRLAVKPGDVFRFRQSMNMDQVVHVNGMDVSTTIEFVQFSKWTVVALRDDGGADCTQTIGRVVGKVENAMLGDFAFDSAKPAEEDDDANPAGKPLAAMAKGFSSVAGATFQMQLSKSGDLVELKGVKEVVEKAAGGKGGATVGALAGMFDDEGVKRQMRQGMGATPDGGADLGQTWSSDANVQQPFQMSIHTDYTLASADADQAVIETKMKMTTDDANPPKPGLNGVTMKLTDSKGVGTITRSRKDGLVMASTTDLAMSMDMTVPQLPDQTMKSEQTTKTRLERIAAEAYEEQPAAPEAAKPSPTKK